MSLKIGDMVKINKPYGHGHWIKEMNKFDEMISRIEEGDLFKGGNWFRVTGGSGYWFLDKWLSPLEKQKIVGTGRCDNCLNEEFPAGSQFCHGADEQSGRSSARE